MAGTGQPVGSTRAAHDGAGRQRQPRQRLHLHAPRALLPGQPGRSAAVVVLVATVMATLFALSYVDALGRPTARALRVAVVGGPGGDAAADPWVAALEASAADGVVLVPAADEAAARALVQRQEVYAVVVVPGGAERRRLELSSASGSSAARVLTAASLQAGERTGLQVATTDLHPLPAADPSGLASFYLVIAATILGFVGTFQLRANAAPLSLRGWLAATGALVVVGAGSLAGAAVALLGVPLPFWEAWWALGLQMATASAFAGTMSVLVGRWAIVPTWALFILLGNTSSGGAVAAALLPEPFSTLSRVLPSGATVAALRAAAYFPGSERWEPRLVLLAWAVAAVVALVVSCRVRSTSPAPG